MKILVIDGQGGNIGKQLVKQLCEKLPDDTILAVGTNSIATSNMLKGGSINVATGENAIVVNAKKADVIVGPVGIVVADALMGEVTPKMAKSIGQSNAIRVLIPFNRCETLVAGVKDNSISFLIDDAVNKIINIKNS